MKGANPILSELADGNLLTGYIERGRENSVEPF